MADRRFRRIFAAAGAAALTWGLFAQDRAAAQVLAPPPVEPPAERTVVVPAAGGWLDTGIDVVPGEEIRFSAAGEINLQKGNPGAACGPEGIDLVTVEQPVPNVNLGALIGRVAQLVARRVDEDSGMEVRDEVFVLFPVGTEGAFVPTFKGRLFLGVNENVLSDNSGEFSVLITRGPA